MVLILLDMIEKEEAVAVANSHVTRGEINPFLLTQLVFSKSCALVVFLCFTTNSLTTAAARAIRHRRSPDGGIQWLPV